MQTPLLLINEQERTDSALLIFGENESRIVAYFESKGIELVHLRSSREFSSYHLIFGDKRYLLVLAGMGSASVEVVMSELSMLGVKNVVHTGSCGASYDYKLGEAKILSSAKANNPGALEYYFEEPKTDFEPHPELIEVAADCGLGHAEMISSDAFYGYGCLLNEARKPVFVGGRVDGEPRGFRKFRDAYVSGRSYLIDMEVAYVYALAELFGIRAVAIKGVSNYVPFEVGNFISKEDEAMENCMSASLRVLGSLCAV